MIKMNANSDMRSGFPDAMALLLPLWLVFISFVPRRNDEENFKIFEYSIFDT